MSPTPGKACKRASQLRQYLVRPVSKNLLAIALKNGHVLWRTNAD